MNLWNLGLDFFDRKMIGCASFGREQKIREAFAKCRPHPHDPEVLETYSPDGLLAIHDPHVKAVIWHRHLSPALKNAVADMDFESAENMTDALYEGGNDYEAIPEPLRMDIEELNALIEKVSPYFAYHFSDKFMSRSGFDSVSYNIHSDDDNDGYTLHVTYKEPGLEWFPGQFTLEQYDDLASIAHSSSYPAGLRSEFTKAGDAILFKGQNTDHHVPDGYVKGLLHRTPDAGESPDESNSDIPPPLPSVNDRLIYTMY